MAYRTHLIGAALLALVAGSTASAQVTQVQLHVKGMTCPFCVYNMEKRIKKIDAIDSGVKLETFLDKGLTVVPWDTSKRFDPALMTQAVKDSGFTLESIEVTASGVLSDNSSYTPDTLALTDPGTGQAFTLVAGDRADHAASWTALNAYADGAGAGKKVNITGVVMSGADGSWRIALERWAPTDFGAEVYLKVKGFQCEKCAARTMKTLGVFDDVIHLEADRDSGLVHVWTRSPNPDTDALSARIDTLGFQCTHADVHAKGDDTHEMSHMSGLKGMSKQ